jgi:hypothetical protein
MNLLFPKKSDDWRRDLPDIADAVRKLIADEFPGGKGMPPIMQNPLGKHMPVKDGDAPNSLGNVQEAHRGHWVVRMISKNFNPTKNLLDGRNNSLGTLTEDECFSGCVFKAQVHPFYYAVGGSVGVSLSMDNVMMIEQGEPLGGGGSLASDAFGVTVTESAADTAFGSAKATEDDAFIF